MSVPLMVIITPVDTVDGWCWRLSDRSVAARDPGEIRELHGEDLWVERGGEGVVHSDAVFSTAFLGMSGFVAHGVRPEGGGEIGGEVRTR